MNSFIIRGILIFVNLEDSIRPGADPGGVLPVRTPPKIGKNMIFLHKIVIFHTKYHTNFRTSLRNWKKYDFLA
jgi:hypothetical protein